MAADFFLTPEAADDANDAYAWYESQRSGLGEEFLSCLDVCIQRICRNPEWSPVVYRQYRRALVRRFPYLVFFEASAKSVIVVAVLHTSRDSRKWRQRLPE